MSKLYEIFKLLWIQKRIVAAATIWGNTVFLYKYETIETHARPFLLLNEAVGSVTELKNVYIIWKYWAYGIYVLQYFDILVKF